MFFTLRMNVYRRLSMRYAGDLFAKVSVFRIARVYSRIRNHPLDGSRGSEYVLLRRRMG